MGLGKFIDRATGGAIKESQVNNAVNSGVQLGTGGLLGYNPSNGFNSGVVGSELKKINPVLNAGYGLIGANGKPQDQASGGSMNSAGIMQPAYQSQLDSPTYRSMQGQYASGVANPWSNMETARQNKLAEKNKQELSDRTAGQTAGSLDKLAATGGLTSGARERTIQAGQKTAAEGTQDIGNALNTNLLQIGIADAEGRQNLGKGLMSAEIGDLTGKNAYNQNKYNTDMQAWAAKQQAAATRDSGKK